jgi:hypothetical protein
MSADTIHINNIPVFYQKKIDDAIEEILKPLNLNTTLVIGEKIPCVKKVYRLRSKSESKITIAETMLWVNTLFTRAHYKK